MDNDQITYIRHRLMRYENSIQETKDHFDELECFGNYRACAPCYEKIGIPVLIDALKSDDAITGTFWQEYDRITGKLKAFEKMKGQTYRDLLYSDLKNYVSAYHSALCYAEINMIAIESAHDLFDREVIRALISELRSDYDITEMEKLVMTLDELFQRMSSPVGSTSPSKSQVFENSGNSVVLSREGPFFGCEGDVQTRHI